MKAKVRNQVDVGINGNYLSHPSNSVNSSVLAIGFIDAVVISRRCATHDPNASKLPYHPACLGFASNYSFPYLMSSFVFILLFLFAPKPPFFTSNGERHKLILLYQILLHMQGIIDYVEFFSYFIWYFFGEHLGCNLIILVLC